MEMRRYNVLLAYDDPHMLKVVGRTLEDRGLDVTTASSGDEAIGLLAQGNFDLVLTDLVMNPASGATVLRKAKEINPGTMVILLGCREGLTYDQEALPPEADEYVFTPCSMAKLWKRVSNCLERLELRRKGLKTDKDIDAPGGSGPDISEGLLKGAVAGLNLVSMELKAAGKELEPSMDKGTRARLKKMETTLEKLTGDIKKVAKV
jgi:DNA-binding NtrC family response regulator